MSTRIALITGAYKGIGLETARQLGARGMTVLLGSRNVGRDTEAERTLREQGIDAHTVPLEVGIRAVHAGAEPSAHLATLPDGGPAGTLYRCRSTREGDGGYEELPW
ncbi:SDR family NAD(P)-dependent oxidoreductase [Mobilicoccus pelagius]|uniref:Oxidoreductase n=1 Tax=Mobilicoccus pelagius NBRC 104925 TaxID=1089455 RepID=H5URL2_9MICO|nr:SDR family NAD(P)-dependent oxidoreductase [Mobilicoccus pelagius]GAB48370.1 hypothetical protein MOPEL_073_00100 [Mobilicoccus pelagius NBRC 104925]